MVVMALAAIVLAITIAAFERTIAEYRQTSVTRRLVASINLARMKAVSTNMDYTFHLDATVSPNTYQIYGTNDTNGNSRLDPWEDVTGSGTIVRDTVYETTKDIAAPIVDHRGVTVFPQALDITQVMDNGTALDLVFNGKGSLKPGGTTIRCIVLQSSGNTQAITIADTGRIRMYKYAQGWSEIAQ
jgi:Tfp pilus assembly protein FimT